MLGRQLIAEMPLPIIRTFVIRRKHLRQSRRVTTERDIVGHTPVGVRPETGQDRRPRRRADRLRAISLSENETLLTKALQVRGPDTLIAMAGKGVISLLVGPKEKDIGGLIFHRHGGDPDA